MPFRSFKTGWPCPYWYGPDGKECEPDAPGAERCHGWADAEGRPCNEYDPGARFEYGIMEVNHPDGFDQISQTKRRLRQCIFCGGLEKTTESRAVKQKAGVPYGKGPDKSIDGMPLDIRDRLFNPCDYLMTE